MSGVLDFGIRAAQAARALASGRASPEVAAARRAQCEACPKIVRTPEGAWCGACGCGRTALAELGFKLGLAHVRCPLGKPGFSGSPA